MNKARTIISFAVLVIGLLGSCSKINERLDGLDKRINNLEIDKIASVEQQIAAINQSIADLGTIRNNIQTLMDAKEAQGEDITTLKAANTTLEGKVAELETYVNTKLGKFATTEWVNATFATLAKQAEIITDITKLRQDLAGLDAELDQAIEDLDSSLKAWVNEQLSAYSTTAQMEAKVKALQDQIDALKADTETNKSDIEDLEAGLAQLEQDLESAKATIKTEYEKAIEDALKGNYGYITEKIKTAISSVNGRVSNLYGRVGTLESQVEALLKDVNALKGLIQSVTIIPAYNDGSVKAEETGIVYIDCIISPASAVSSLTEANFTVLVNEVPMTGGVTSISITEDMLSSKDASKGTVSLAVPMSSHTSAGSAITVAVRVNYKHRDSIISDITTDFVPVTVSHLEVNVTSVSLNKTELELTLFGTETLTANVLPENATNRNVTWESNNDDIATVDATGKVTAVAAGTATITATTVNGSKTATCTVTVKILTFKAVYNSTDNANTLTFYYDAVDHSEDGIVYEDGTDSYLFNNSKSNGAKWGYTGKRGEIKSVVIDASVADYTGLTTTAFMFQSMTAATNISGAEYLDVSDVTDMSYMFNNFGGGNTNSHTTLNSVPNVSGWNTDKVTNMTAMFESYGNFSDNLAIVPDVSNWNTGEVTDMTFMFQKYGHESQNFNAVPDVSNWNTGKVTNMKQMFMEYGHKSSSLDAVPDVSNWKTDNVTNMLQMFYNYGSTSENISCVLDLSGWDLSKITGTNGNNVFAFTPKTFDVTIPAKTGEKPNKYDEWYYGDGTNHIAPPTNKTFTILPTGAL